jgi:hypothetical protein
MAKSSTIGLLKNVSTAAGSACPRQEAAQIIYNALTLPILQANALGVLVPSSDTILSKYLGGASEVVVVTGNEEAALNDTTPLDEGTTEVDNSTILNWSTGLDDIGESFTVWTVGNTVVYAEKANNTVVEFTAATSAAGISDKDAGMKLAGAEQYVNFGDGTTYTSSDYKIKYVIELTGLTADEQAAYTKANGGSFDGDVYTKQIKAGNTLTATDLTNIKAIFDEADKNDNYIKGEVYVGTQSLKDVSDEISYKAFLAKYVSSTEEDANAKVNENGNYIKVIDNDGDGVAEYILKTEYVMAAVKSIAKNGNYTLTSETEAVRASAVVSEDELAVGDVIVYAYIDGVYYANLAEIVTDTTDAKKAIDYKAVTLTCGENVYENSGIIPVTTAEQKAFQDAFLYDTFYFDLTDAADNTTYDLYLDNYGYVRAYTVNKTTNTLALLTDGYYWTDKKTSESKVDLVAGDADEATYTVARDLGSFVDTEDEGTNGSRGTWGRLNGFKGAVHDFATNVAATAITDDSVVLKSATAYTNRNLIVDQKELDLTGMKLNSEKLTAITKAATTEPEAAAETATVYATTDTVYYYVTTVRGDLVVQSWTGYKNAPSKLTLDATADKAYAVYTQTNSVGKTYYYADVVVIEATSSATSLSFAYYANTKTEEDKNDASYWLKTIAYDDETEAWDTAAVVENVGRTEVVAAGVPNFYYTDGKGTTTALTTKAALNAKNVYAATSVVDVDVNNRDYVYMDNDTRFRSVPVYVVTYNAKVAASNEWVAYGVADCDEVNVGDQLIYVTDGAKGDDGNVLYAINVTKSNTKDNGFADLTDLFKTIAGITDTYKVTVNKPATGVTVTSNPETLTGLAADTEVTLSVTVTEKEKQATVKVNGVEKDAEANGTDYKFTVTEDTTVEITLTDKTYTVAIQAAEGDEGVAELSATSGNGKKGDKITFTVTLYDGYEIKSVKIGQTDVKSVGGTYTYTITGEETGDSVIEVTTQAITA